MRSKRDLPSSITYLLIRSVTYQRSQVLAHPREIGPFLCRPASTLNRLQQASQGLQLPSHQSLSDAIFRNQHEFAHRWRTAFSRRSSVLDPSLLLGDQALHELGPSFL